METYCTTCGTVAEPWKRHRGSLWIAVLLCFLGIIPGLVYLVWMIVSPYYLCPACGSQAIVPLTSPVAIAAVGRVPPAAPKRLRGWTWGERFALAVGILLFLAVCAFACLLGQRGMFQ